MTALNKQALREMAERAASDSWGYDRDEFNDAITPEVVLALLDELEAAENNLIDSECHVAELEESLRDKQALLEAAEERYEDMLRQARSFREAHDSAAEIIRKLERNKPTVTLPTTRLWAGKVACYEECEIREILRAAGIGVKGE
nr:ead/Ea22-like family protein [Escherichia coli]